MNRMHILALGITAAMSGGLCLSNTGSTGAKSAGAGPMGWEDESMIGPSLELGRKRRADGQGAKARPMNSSAFAEYQKAIQQTTQMVNDREARDLARRHGLDILNVTWEDTGRYKGSAVGPNISDMTIQVGAEDPRSRQFQVSCMPVIRFPNFSDVTADIDPRDFTLLVGNENGKPLKRVSLFEFLESPTEFLSNPRSWKGRNRSLLAERDTHVLVSAQACFLPVPKSGKARFNPVLFNYQSSRKNPAVLTILATREGTSVTVIDNTRDAFETGSVWGQRLFHNQDGDRASLTGERMSDFKASGGDRRTGGVKARESGMNMVLLIQVPLKYKEQRPMFMGGAGGAMDGAAAPMMKSESRGRSDVENAVIGHGEIEGPFTEIDNLAIERDPRFPVRVTVQFYKATSNGVVDEKDLAEIKAQLNRVYQAGDYVGSLVTEGETGRPTEYEGLKVQPPYWWADFWRRHYQNTGDTPEEARRKLIALLGSNYRDRPVCELYLRDLLREKKPDLLKRKQK